MSSVLLVEPITFGPNPKTKDNALIQSMTVSNAMADMDRSRVCALVSDLSEFFESQCGIHAVVIRQASEPKLHIRPLIDKGQSVCVADNLSFHNFVDAEGVIQRRVVVFHPMSPLRRGELARKQLVDQITSVAEAGAAVEVIDLRGYEAEDKFLEGSGSLVFSPGCRYVYMAVSQRSDPEVLDTLCSRENLNIPASNRFLLRSKDGLPHTNVLGWCGHGICAWCFNNLVFETEDAETAFYDHLSQSYSCVMELSEGEMHGFAGSAVEVFMRPSGVNDGSAHNALVISESALAALSPKNRTLLNDWYDVDHIHTFYGEMLERRCGTSLPSCIALSYTHGSCPPAPEQESICEMLKLGDRK
ncbi:putative mitochondrial hypothetical protein [Leptomonas pyrrhocoris]|uniref:Amidinotransferase n=1 Tax=Leptomonas pyrrhocoris TaxID=157538 RepID=A0A0N0DX65_LEPPY|nr:putative mitochondrial hypothetical protein [Leptomonas pyrrhocoris]XP_015660882.1 putative mitochondrial hypothetical protein [Leptomonas pyrrhocoris]XP_015660883.1 putative mitochondrial hypothetical protein [Leptomonas pyrrhocoris]KPA82442.1 putative mitochondrial hypothetical protein [Leptomonas pyrrhocoris]KPA82443.1 putative mitochondrial hypothetical protein [Leptomonas pyrrhocoris]KPA82444.1 putative mitochondrial hypothetical protein [Leptomonas pyrrhocoris]|eukprot:XP_015660881.1 putative mitochondrial hypothetical protein [Leptomonas pyrrhocoris]